MAVDKDSADIASPPEEGVSVPDGSGIEGPASTSTQTTEGTEISFSLKTESDVTSQSAVSLDGDGAPAGKETDTALQPTMAEPSSSADMSSDGKSTAVPKEKEGKQKEGVDDVAKSESESEDSEAEKEGDSDEVIRISKPDTTSKDILKAYEEKLKKRAERKKTPQRSYGPKVVEGLVDYLRVLEDRMARMETSLGLKEALEKEGKSKGEDGKGSQEAKPITDLTVAIETKFFDAAGTLNKEGSFPVPDKNTERGTFMCGSDEQQLIRVLYSKRRHDGAPPKKVADTQDPNPDDIDIENFGVSSEAITAFLAKHMEIPNSGSHNLVRFGKPFRPVLRNLNLIREHLKKLEEKYGGVVIEDPEKIKESAGASPAAPQNADAIEDPEIVTPTLKTPGGEVKGDEGKPRSGEEKNNKGENDKDNSENLKAKVEDQSEPFERPTALAHFRGFVEFVEKYLGKQIQQYQRLRSGKDQHVAFENLWMLFDAPSDETEIIYCPLRETGSESYSNMDGEDHNPTQRYTPQAYRVVAISGGLPFNKTMAPISRGMQSGDGVDSTLAATKNTDPVLDMAPKNWLKSSRRVRKSYSELRVYCYYIDFDGSKYGVVPEVFVFKPYEIEMEIRNLQAYPIKYAPNHDLEGRGRKFLENTKIQHLQYDGLTVGPNKEEISGPVVVDLNQAFRTASEMEDSNIVAPEFGHLSNLWLYQPDDERRELIGAPSCPHRWCFQAGCTKDLYTTYQRSLREKVESDLRLILEEYESDKQRGDEGVAQFNESLARHDLIKLLPGQVPGFALRTRRWVLLRLDKLSEVQHNNEWEKLVLPPGHQRMVQAMVETYTQGLGSTKDPKMGMDLVRGKGAGCIILLHGVPGVGKTSTAECVAAHTKRPLYPITCGDIGYDPDEVEKNMTGHFNLAHRWGCVLLLDEADVFLAKRDKQDVYRNGLVSVFLRILEYYSGILFLTTNRVGAIDDAFRSRLHLTLYYPKLTLKQMKNIFKNNFNHIKDINAEREKQKLPPFDYEDDRREIVEWAAKNRKKLRWNGRQIRNAFQTVLALTEFDANQDAKKKNKTLKSLPVTIKHFTAIAEATDQFNKYLLKTHGKDEDDIAKREFIRAVDSSSSEEEDTSSDESSDDDSESDKGSSDESDESDVPKKKKKGTSSKSSKDKSSKKGKGEKESKSTSSSKKSKKAADEGSSEKKSKDKKGKKKKNEETDSD